jgi:CHAT domain-containing protein
MRGIGGTVPLDGAGPAPVSDNPLLLSGLAFAGANLRGPPGTGDDGILTAEEIGAVDLRSVRWAVISACESGVGEVQDGEGVLGLRRAFQVAGARTTIMSLWPVSDNGTRQWMRALYGARLHGGRDTAESVREASLEVLQDLRRRGESTHPFTWGAFVASGDWR